MIFYRGLGFLAIVIPLATVIICQLILGDGPIVTGIAYFCSGFIVYRYGRKLNEEYNLRSADTKDIIAKIDADHSLFFVRMEYWSILITIIGLGVLIPNSDSIMGIVIQGFFIFLFIICAITGIRYSIYKYQKKYKNPNKKNRIKSHSNDDKQLTRREKLLGTTSQNEPSNSTESKSEAIQKLKALRDQPNKQIEVDHSKYKPQ